MLNCAKTEKILNGKLHILDSVTWMLNLIGFTNGFDRNLAFSLFEVNLARIWSSSHNLYHRLIEKYF